jgi:hypothetical protein
VIVATTGHRDPSRWPRGAVDGWRRLLADERVAVVRVGGAVGWDTHALGLADVMRSLRPRGARWRVELYCTGRVVDLPSLAHSAANRCLRDGDELVELCLADHDSGSGEWALAAKRRNGAMLVGGRNVDGKLSTTARADMLFAAWDGEERGGTWDCVQKARAAGIPVREWR